MAPATFPSPVGASGTAAVASEFAPGEFEPFPWVDEPPEQAELTIHTVQAEPEAHAQKIVAWLRQRGYV